MSTHYPYRRGDAGAAERLVPAMVLIAVGGFFLLRNLHIVYFGELFAWWPALLISFGVVKLVDSADTGGRAFGAIIIAGGGILLARNLGFLDVRLRDLWPLFLIGSGLLMLFQRTWPGQLGFGTVDFTGDTLQESALFSGGKRQITTQDFRGGKVDAVFGGFELDFRQAGIAGDSAVLRVDAVFGGAEIKIPKSWNVQMQGSGVFGAFSDETKHPDRTQYPEIKQFIVKGGTLFGGVVVKN